MATNFREIRDRMPPERQEATRARTKELLKDLDGMSHRVLLERITTNPELCGGRPCIRGMRIRVIDVLELLAAGETREQILADYPYLGHERAQPSTARAPEPSTRGRKIASAKSSITHAAGRPLCFAVTHHPDSTRAGARSRRCAPPALAPGPGSATGPERAGRG